MAPCNDRPPRSIGPGAPDPNRRRAWSRQPDPPAGWAALADREAAAEPGSADPTSTCPGHAGPPTSSPPPRPRRRRTLRRPRRLRPRRAARPPVEPEPGPRRARRLPRADAERRRRSMGPGRAALVGALVGALVAALVASLVAVEPGRRRRARAGAGHRRSPRPTGHLDIQAILAMAQPSVVTIQTSAAPVGPLRGRRLGHRDLRGRARPDERPRDRGLGRRSRVVLLRRHEHDATLVGSFPDDDMALIQRRGRRRTSARRAGLVRRPAGRRRGGRHRQRPQPRRRPERHHRHRVGPRPQRSTAPGVTLDQPDPDRRRHQPRQLRRTARQPAGEVVGINTAIIHDAQNIGFAMAIDPAKPLIEDLKDGRAARSRRTPAFLGVGEPRRRRRRSPTTCGSSTASTADAGCVRQRGRARLARPTRPASRRAT